MPFPFSNFKSFTKKPETQEPDQQLKQSKNPPLTTSSISNDEEKTEALRAFRTITTMLSLIQPTSGNDTTGDEKNSDTSKKTLTILNPLSVIVSREHGVAAAVVGKDNGSGTTQVVVSITHFNHDKGPLIVPQQSLKSLFTHFFVTQNPRYQMVDGPIISNLETAVPKYLKDQDGEGEKLLTTFLIREWTKPHDTPQSFATHIWMITKVIGRSPRTFALYIIATCYLRILRRLNYCISKSFNIALTKLQIVEFSEQPHNSTPSETENDILFLSKLPDLEPLLHNKIPYLMQKGQDPLNSEVYTNKTCTEFHLLLCELLEKFSKYLEDLEALQKKPSTKEDILKQLDLILRVGTTLRLMVRGAAIKKHLKVVENFLPVSKDFVKQKQGGRDGGEGEDKDKDKEDEEFTELHSDNSSSAWKACFNWLELIVVHFDAIQVLGHFISNHATGKIDIKILSQQLPDTQMLTWKQLLEHKKHFPADRPGVTSKDLIAFLSPQSQNVPKSKSIKNKKPASGDVVELLMALHKFDFPIKKAEVDACSNAIDNIIHHIGSLTNCTSPVLIEYIGNIVDALKDFQNGCILHKPDEATKQINEITSMVKTLRANARLRTSLREGSPLHTGRGCKSDYHCEGCLATYCTHGVNGLDQFISEKAIGVSKRCCPVCAYLLKLLNPQFDFTAAHSRISSYSLPDYLPMVIIDGMISKFGGQLREELASLKERTEILQNCDASIHSQGLSDSGSAHTFVDAYRGSDSE